MTGTPPEALLKRPQLPAYLAPWLRIFFSLNRGRPLGGMGGAGPIPLSEMLAYMQIYGIDTVEERHWFVQLMGDLDSAYLERMAKKVKS